MDLLPLRSLAWAIAAHVFLASGLALALTPIDRADLSADITQVLDGQTVTDEDVAADDLASGFITLASLGVLPTNADVSAYHLLANGDHLLAFDITVSLGGSLVATPADVVRWNGASYALEFDGSAAGVPAGARVDAVTLESSGDLVLSFDTTVLLSGAVFADEDLVQFDGAVFTSYFDGSAAGIGSHLDVDGAHIFPGTGQLALSFDTSGTLGGVSFDDEDVLEVDPAGATWEMAWDASVERTEWNPGADADAVFFAPEPGAFAMLSVGGLLLAAAGRRRLRRARPVGVPA